MSIKKGWIQMENWKKVLIRPSVSIHQALGVIEAGGIQIVLVTDPKNHLLGTLTDGDVRRGILKGTSLDEPVERVMRSEPLVAGVSDTKEHILVLMRQRGIHQIPILDEQKRVVGIEISGDFSLSNDRDNMVILMAGGLGSRLPPLTEKTPKPMLSVGSKPILEIIVENFIDCGFKKFCLSVNYKKEIVKNYFGDGSKWKAEISYLHEDQRLGTAGCLSLLSSKPKAPFFVMNGDVLTKVNFNRLLEFHRENKADATMCVREYDFQVPYGVVKMDQHHVRNIDEKPVHRFFVNAGIYLLEPGVLRFVQRKKMLDMTDLLGKLIADKKKVSAFPIKEYWLDIGRIGDLERANGDFSSVFK